MAKTIYNTVQKVFSYLHNNVKALNDSKIFAGLMIITLNIASRFVTIKMSKTMQSYLKVTFSRYILVFAIAWMGTRDIYIALGMTILFVIVIDHLFDEESSFYLLPEEFKDYHTAVVDEEDDTKEISEEEVKKAQKTLEKAQKQKNLNLDFQGYNL
jgi:hypothetical protein|tara:strand:+ start:1897 stop:2364 length:468 start_codon:yes stop_codon:yes gene_type:complete